MPTELRAGELLGSGHHAIVDALVERIRELENPIVGSTPPSRIVLLRGESGVGKSRIIRELYERMRSRPSHPKFPGQFWPPLPGPVASNGGARDPMPGRKIIGPRLETFVWPARTLPTFTWWSLDCAQLPSGAPIDVIRQAADSIEVNLLPAELAWNATRGPDVADRVTEILSRYWKTQVSLVGDELLNNLVGQALSSVVPGFPLIHGFLSDVAKGLSRRGTQQSQLASDFAVGSDRSKASETARFAAEISRCAHAGIPAVIVIEDMHDMHDSLGELINRVADDDAKTPVLVVGTIWPEGQQNVAYERWINQSRLIQPEIKDVAALDENDRLELLRNEAPLTDNDTARAVVQRFPNTLALLLFLSLRKVRRHIVDGCLCLDASALEQLPENIEDLYKLRWAELPESVQGALRLAVGTLSAQDNTGSWRFSRDIVARAAIQSGLFDGEDVDLVKLLIESAQVHRWADPAEDSDTGLSEFREEILAHTARASLRQHYDDEEIEDLLTETRSLLREWIKARREFGKGVELGDELGQHAARWFLTLESEDAQATTESLAASIAVARSLTQSGPEHYEAALESIRNIDLAGLDPDARDTLWLRSELANVLFDAHQDDEAIRRYGKVLDEQMRLLGPDDLDTLRTRHMLAYSHGCIGEWESAASDNAEIVKARRRRLGISDPTVRTSLRNHAFALGKCGKFEESLDEYQALIEACRLADDGDAATELTLARLERAMILKKAGRRDDARTDLSALLFDHPDAVDSDDSSLLTAAYEYASILAGDGLFPEAAVILLPLVETQERVFGARSLNATYAQWLCALVLYRTGPFDECVRLARRAFDVWTNGELPGHPSSEHALGMSVLLADAGTRREAIDILNLAFESEVEPVAKESLALRAVQLLMAEAHYFRREESYAEAIFALDEASGIARIAGLPDQTSSARRSVSLGLARAERPD